MRQAKVLRTDFETRPMLDRLIRAHFAAARCRVGEICEMHFYSLGAVTRRHWRQRRDVPRDLAAVPRAGWALVRKVAGKPAAPEITSGKEQELLTVIRDELLQLEALAEVLRLHLRDELVAAGIDPHNLARLLEPANAPEIDRWLEDKVGLHGVALEGARESLMFVALGFLGRTFSDKLVFGSSMGLGAAAASSFYLHHQSWWGAFMAQVYGTPGWVSAVGMASGLAATLVAMPLLAPLVETGINRFRAERLLLRIIDGVEFDMMQDSGELAGVAGRLATFISLVPDILQLLARLQR